MDEPLKVVPAEQLRALIARRYLGVEDHPRELGAIRLRDHQIDAVGRLRKLLTELAGALLADEVGLGKTYTALAVARGFRQVRVVAPASLLPMWKTSAALAAIPNIAYTSHEALSRRKHIAASHDLLIVDEAHHARNPATQRYAQLATLAAAAPVLLISATPVHNREHDLRALCALFLGSRAWTCDLREIMQAVVRREQKLLDSLCLPLARPAMALRLAHNDDMLDEIVSLPPPVPPRDGGDGGALVMHGLVRQWASSDAALINALTRRKARAIALVAALEGGRYPTGRELRAWTHSEDSVQLAFPSLLAELARDTTALIEAVSAHERAVSALLRKLKSAPRSDRERSEHLIGLRRLHPRGRIIAFTQFADTAHALFTLLAPTGRVAVLTARGALAAGGKLTRAEALTRFNAASVHPAEGIDILIATDLLSEGIDLPEASVVVHLDLPWTPARLEQRVGRAVRLGSRQREVFIYHMVPPASASALLRVEDVLKRKLGDAARTVGIAGAILPSLRTVELVETTPATVTEEQIRRLLTRWLTAEPANSASRGPLVASVRGPQCEWIACVAEADGRTSLVACVDGHVTDDPIQIASVVADCGGADSDVDWVVLQRVLGQINRWTECRSGAAAAGLSIAPAARFSVRLLKRIGAIANRAPFHRRTDIASLASHARRAVLTPRGIGAERVLAELADSPLGDDAWLRAVGAFAAANASSAAVRRESQCRVIGVLLVTTA